MVDFPVGKPITAETELKSENTPDGEKTKLLNGSD